MKQPVAAITISIVALAGALMLDRAGGLRPRGEVPRSLPMSVSTAPAASARDASAAKPPREAAHHDTIDSLPPGKGQEETFYTCAACHGTALIKQQGLSRDLWEASLQLMIERHGMAPPDEADRALILDYLAANFPPRRKGRGSDNPFLK
jgi:hypothetical protein